MTNTLLDILENLIASNEGEDDNKGTRPQKMLPVNGKNQQKLVKRRHSRTCQRHRRRPASSRRRRARSRPPPRRRLRKEDKQERPPVAAAAAAPPRFFGLSPARLAAFAADLALVATGVRPAFLNDYFGGGFDGDGGDGDGDDEEDGEPPLLLLTAFVARLQTKFPSLLCVAAAAETFFVHRDAFRAVLGRDAERAFADTTFVAVGGGGGPVQ
ncbi:hypothetical protein DFJ73DRAFT_961407, partial [Zopfochytrium polystomum]